MLTMNPAGERKLSGVLTVGQVSHHRIELIWQREERQSSSPDSWSLFILEQKNKRKDTYKEIYKGYSTQFTVENLEPRATYTFRLKAVWPPDHQLYYPIISASTEKEPLNGRNLHDAVLGNNELDLCMVLQSKKITVDVPDKLGFTPLMMAAMRGFTSGVQILVQHGADVNQRTSSGKDSLMLACFHGHLDVVKFLCSCGASWSSQDESGCSALHWATYGGHQPVLNYLIQEGCEVDVRDCVSWTPLMKLSVVTGDTDVASLLITAGADVNIQDRDGRTPLMAAVLNNYEQLVKLLMENGADPHIQNKVGVNAVEMANAFERQNIVTLLLNDASEIK